MGTLEIVLISVIFGGISLSLVYLLFSNRKKAPKAEEASKGTVEPVYKKEQIEEPEQKIVQEPLKIIRKQSEVKINKKALKGDSRNPSITRVFVNGKRVDEEQPEEEKPEQTQEKPNAMSDIVAAPVGRFGTREPVFSDGRARERSPFEMPNRAPIIGDRTNFTSRLHVSEDNNLSGVAGTGIAKALNESENKMKDVDQKTESMVEDIRRNLLGLSPYEDDFYADKKAKNKVKIKDFDAKTLVVADIINRPKFKTGS